MALWVATIFVLGTATNVFDFHAAYISKFVQSELAELHAAPIKCPTYTCGTFSTDQCVDFDAEKNEYVLQACANNDQFCPVAIDSSTNSTCLPAPPSPTTLGNPGDYCAKPGDCSGLSPTCVNNICHGLAVNHTCSDQPDCDVGLMCENPGEDGTCQYQIETGKACQTWVFDVNCINGDVCNNNMCVAMFSQPIGAIVSTDYGYLSCSTGFYQSFPGFIERGMCAPAPKSPLSLLPIPCQPGTLCYSADGAYATPCQCGINPNGDAFCPVFPGDDLYQNYLSMMKQYITQAKPNACHELDFGQEDCGAPDGTFQALNKAKVTVDLQVEIQENTDCIKSVYTQAYWALQEELSLY